MTQLSDLDDETQQVPTEPDERARATEAAMTDDERFAVIVNHMASGLLDLPADNRIPDNVPVGAGYTPGVPRLGVPPMVMTDASLGVTNPGYRDGDTATALPAGLALGASFNPALARRAGTVLGRESLARGFNVMLAGGVNLARDPRNGRNFEYLSEDPLLTATIAAESIAGIQHEGVLSTIKHFSLNCNETNSRWIDARIDPAAHRESDLLAFEIAIERAQPGAVMTAYNKVNGEQSGGSREIVTNVLKDAWNYPGFVMSDWGATPDWEYSLAGLDMESGVQVDTMIWGDEAFTHRLRAALADGRFPRERLSDMVRRILRSIYTVGLDRSVTVTASDIDAAAHDAVALDIARQGTVLLTNDGILPLASDLTGTIAVIGGYAQLGVISGTGSSAVVPPGGYAAKVNLGGFGIMSPNRNLFVLPDSPLVQLRAAYPDATIEYDPGMSPAEAASLAARSDLAIVFGIRVDGQGYDLIDLDLPWGQNAVITAVAAANANTVVVLEAGNPVSMPWKDQVRAILHAWYPGQAGGRAITGILTGATNPSGRLPMTFPTGVDAIPRPALPGQGTPWGTPTTIEYSEGSNIGYRWAAAAGNAVLFPFGHGLSYTTFEHSDITIAGSATLTAEVTVTNTGTRAGADVPQLYLTGTPDHARQRLLGFERVELQPGESTRVRIAADRRLLADYDQNIREWVIPGGTFTAAVGHSATELAPHHDVAVNADRFGR
ncbi:beta-glucosidase family protein [Curtobacterium pusillum]|uniref:beta-glucosidase family protein n=1 Tax=Curtobacterium pusillum TaxID=69373 RepID=UPI0016429B37|nr:beta-glucosidase [Curtobacterium pusillum]